MNLIGGMHQTCTPGKLESFKIRSSGWMYQQSLTLRNVPGYSCLKPFLDLMCRRISESPLGLADVRQAVTHVACPKIAINRPDILQIPVQRCQCILKHPIEIV